ncbi:MAG TPA: hypothetical protein VN723_11915 [Rhizomicrobium sp.]|jgi:hypothetical protein|nr:hypothetical protein [Rhizomicrobium sp.]
MAQTRPILATRDVETPFRVSLAHVDIREPDFEPVPDAQTRLGSLIVFGGHLLRDMTVLMFALTGGLTLSGIIANIYRMLARKPQTKGETVLYYAVMAFAGASVLLENATRSYRKKESSAPAYGFAVAIVGYWCFILGIGILSVAVFLKHG